MYDLARYVPRCNQQTIAAKKADDTGISRRVPSPPSIDLYAVSVARRTPEQNQRRIQGHPSTGINNRRASNETTPGGRCSSNLEPDRQHPPFVPRSRERVRKIFCRRKAFAS